MAILRYHPGICLVKQWETLKNFSQDSRRQDSNPRTYALPIESPRRYRDVDYGGWVASLLSIMM